MILPSTATDPRALVKELRERIFPSHAKRPGTISYERLNSANAIASLLTQRDELLAALTELLAAADNSINPPDNDDVAAMIRYGEAEKESRATIERCKP